MDGLRGISVYVYVGALLLAILAVTFLFVKQGSQLAFNVGSELEAEVSSQPGRGPGINASSRDDPPPTPVNYRATAASPYDQQTRQMQTMLRKKTAEYNTLKAEYDALLRRLDQEDVLLLGAAVGTPQGTERTRNPNATDRNVSLSDEAAAFRAEADERVREVEKKAKEDLDEAQKRAEEQLNEMRMAGVQLATMLEEEQLLTAEAARTLARIGTSAVPYVEELLRSNDAVIRAFAARVLGSIGPDAAEAVPSLVTAFSDPDETVRNAARDAVAAIDRQR